MKIAIVRGSYFNKFEMQNYEPLAKDFEMVGFSGLNPIQDKFSFPLVKLASPVDLPNFPYKMPILNRLCGGDAMYLWGLEDQLKGFDVVHTRETYFHMTQQALDAKAKGYVAKVICTCSETIPFNHEGIWNRKKFKQRAIKEVDLFHCISQKAKQCLIKEGCSQKKITVFPYGVDLKKFKSKFNKSSSVIRILFVGRLVKEKGVYDLLKIFISLYKSNKNIRLNIVGNGSEKDNIFTLINQIRLEKVIKINPKIPYQYISRYYHKNDIFCLLSKPTKHWEEYFGMALVEAMASGLAVIATRCGAMPEVLGKAGVLIKPGDWQKGEKVVEKLIKNKSLRKNLGTAAQKRAKKYFDAQKAAENIKKLWKK